MPQNISNITIKETAGKVLLYAYQLQRINPLVMPHCQIGFLNKGDKGMGLTSDKQWLMKDLKSINPAAVDVYNALNFLLDKGYITSRHKVSASAQVYIGMQLTSNGIDIVEGVDGGSTGKKEFEKAFNIEVGSDMTSNELTDSQLDIFKED